MCAYVHVQFCDRLAQWSIFKIIWFHGYKNSSYGFAVIVVVRMQRFEISRIVLFIDDANVDVCRCLFFVRGIMFIGVVITSNI
jgi:hypothetical protein